MKDFYSMSIGLDYRNDGENHEVEIGYWDSNDLEAMGKGNGKTVQEGVTDAFNDLVADIYATTVLDEAEEYADYCEDIQEYVEDLEKENDALIEENEILLDENDRLEYRIAELQSQVRSLQEAIQNKKSDCNPYWQNPSCAKEKEKKVSKSDVYQDLLEEIATLFSKF